MKPDLKILFLDILTDDPKYRKDFHGKVYGGQTYSELMRKAFGLGKDSWVEVDGHRCEFPENLNEFGGVVIGGSLEDPIKGKVKPWMRKNFVFIRKIARSGLPILGICGGLQFTASALGSNVIYNPKGKEFGSGELIMTKNGLKDPIFRGLPGTFIVQLSHKCIASGLKKKWKILGASYLCRPQAIAIGKNIRLLQFHPEMMPRHLSSIAKLKAEKHNLPLRSSSRYGKKILNNFLKYFVLPYHKEKLL